MAIDRENAATPAPPDGRWWWRRAPTPSIQAHLCFSSRNVCGGSARMTA